jgi:hypothetical protein
VPDGPRDERERKPHRSDLCEACGSFGNCQGAFFEPFIMSSAIALLTEQRGTRWASSGDILVANAGLHSVAMLPHISSGAVDINPFAGGSSWGTKSSGKGKAHGNSGQGAADGGGKVRVQECFKCGKHGHIARDCPRGGSGGNEGVGGKSKGKGKVKGEGKAEVKCKKGGRAWQVCHHWQAGKCSFGERCHFLHE